MKRISTQSDQIKYSPFDNSSKCNSCKSSRWVCILASTVNVACLLYLLLYWVLMDSLPITKKADIACHLFPNGAEKCLKAYPHDDKFLGPGVLARQRGSLNGVDRHTYAYLIRPESLCSGGPLLLLVGVCSQGGHFEYRKAIRDSWGHVTRQRQDVRVAFLLGRPINESLQSAILQEAEEYGDVIQEDFLDSYNNLSVKSVMLLRWASHFCPNAAFVLKTDDDMFIHLPNLLNYLSAIRGQPRQLFGHLYAKAKPNRSRASKRFSLLRSFRGQYFPNYLSGGAYVMSSDAVKELFAVATRIPLFLIEDVFVTGICARHIFLIPKDHGSFHVPKNNSVCSYKNAISSHDFKPDEMRLLWKNILMTKC